MTERCGWDVSDVLRILESAAACSTGMTGVERRSPFDGVLTFETADQAALVGAELRSDRTVRADAAARELLEVKRPRPSTCSFPPVEEMSVTAVGGDHHTACILHAGEDEPA